MKAYLTPESRSILEQRFLPRIGKDGSNREFIEAVAQGKDKDLREIAHEVGYPEIDSLPYQDRVAVYMKIINEAKKSKERDESIYRGQQRGTGKGAVQAGAETILSDLTFGQYPRLRAIGDTTVDEERARIGQLQEEHPWATIGSSVAGAFLPSIASKLKLGKLATKIPKIGKALSPIVSGAGKVKRFLDSPSGGRTKMVDTTEDVLRALEKSPEVISGTRYGAPAARIGLAAAQGAGGEWAAGRDPLQGALLAGGISAVGEAANQYFNWERLSKKMKTSGLDAGFVRQYMQNPEVFIAGVGDIGRRLHNLIDEAMSFADPKLAQKAADSALDEIEKKIGGSLQRYIAKISNMISQQDSIFTAFREDLLKSGKAQKLPSGELVFRRTPANMPVDASLEDYFRGLQLQLNVLKDRLSTLESLEAAIHLLPAELSGKAGSARRIKSLQGYSDSPTVMAKAGERTPLPVESDYLKDILNLERGLIPEQLSHADVARMPKVAELAREPISVDLYKHNIAKAMQKAESAPAIDLGLVGTGLKISDPRTYLRPLEEYGALRPITKGAEKLATKGTGVVPMLERQRELLPETEDIVNFIHPDDEIKQLGQELLKLQFELKSATGKRRNKINEQITAIKRRIDLLRR